ncbi:Trypsin-like peptidase domain-containing protein [Nitrosomonas ureae]|uniref:Trypsin-like peptidase domain-containing protein n=1 Tax=Nitrosomonas ureae TaxID=44577 RepID=A0A285C024_9PROT|nr:trypsin-like peptidase domain-containing protein [Nitrosomonas ureae]SNX60675.1 Trypsin-like peptidase domain-containing protein [Nitrosomonas ureae]
MKNFFEANPGLTDNFRRVAQKSLTNLAEKLSKPNINFSPSKNSEQNLLALKEIIKSNGLEIEPSELNQWLHGNEQFLKNEEMMRIDEQLLPKLYKNSALVHKTLYANALDPVDSSRRSGQICKLTVANKKGRVLSNGTGYFLSDDLLLTCRHVLSDQPLNDLNISVHLPHFHGPSPYFPGVIARSEIRFPILETQNKPTIHIESPKLPDNQETGTWDGVVAPQNRHLDYCILEIDKNAEMWSIGIIGPRSELPHVNANFVLSHLPNQLPAIKKPATLYQAGELEGETIHVHTLTDELKIDTISGGSVLKSSNEFRRIRYGDGKNIEHGDSGSPITNSEGELIGIHNAYSQDQHGQAIPIGEIYKDIQERCVEIYNIIFAN